MGRWRLPPPVQSEAKAAGDLMQALESGTGAEEQAGESAQPEMEPVQQVAART